MDTNTITVKMCMYKFCKMIKMINRVISKDIVVDDKFQTSVVPVQQGSIILKPHVILT